MFDIIQPEKAGFLGLEADFFIPKDQRGKVLSTGGHVEPEGTPFLNNYGLSTPVEPANTLFWRADPQTPQKPVTPQPQPISTVISVGANVFVGAKKAISAKNILPRGAWGGYSFAMPARHQGSNSFRPLEHPRSGGEDLDFEEAFAFPARGWGGTPPIGVDAIILATTAHGLHEKMAFWAGGAPLVAHHRGNRPPDYSRHVFDIQGDSPDPERHAGLHSIFHVREWVEPCAGLTGSGKKEFTIAIVGNNSPDGTGLQHVTYGNVDALFSFLASGPLRYATPKHTLALTGDGPIRAGAIDLNAYYTDGSSVSAQAGKTGAGPAKAEIPDGPLDFHKELYPTVMNGIHPYEVHLHWDPAPDHPFNCGPRKGLWRWFVKIPIAETPPCRPTQGEAPAYDAGPDSNGNPRRLFPLDQRMFSSLKTQTPGIYFQPRPGIIEGKPETMLYERAV